ncbi:carbonic anhydrase [Kordiimonas sp.]|uniref:carbonic anhydrase n=1 Tax=Kordiimonas sp. TaxID=1970157 RepID=UPI003A92AFA4
MKKIVEGVLRFKEEVYPQRLGLFKELSSGQSPEVLMITCADSRVDPGLITQAEPGELFICRNAGNIVPPYSQHTGGNTASIEFAVGVLKISEIVVCGHTDCGAMKGAMNPDGLDGLPHVCNWLSHSHAAVHVAKEKTPNAEGTELLKSVTEQNVLLQLQHLKTHPLVAAGIAAGRIRLHGWVYDIEHGEVLAYDAAADAFLPLADTAEVAA